MAAIKNVISFRSHSGELAPSIYSLIDDKRAHWHTVTTKILGFCGLKAAGSLLSPEAPCEVGSSAEKLGFATLTDFAIAERADGGAALGEDVWTRMLTAFNLCARYSISPRSYTAGGVVEANAIVLERLGQPASGATEWHSEIARHYQEELQSEGAKHQFAHRKLRMKAKQAIQLLGQAEQRRSALEEQVAAKESELARANEHNLLLQEECETLAAAFTKIDLLTVELSRAKKQRDHAVSELSSLEDITANLSERTDLLQQKHRELLQQASLKDEENAELRQTISNLDASIEHLRGEIEAFRDGSREMEGSGYISLERKFDALTLKHDQLILELETTTKALRQSDTSLIQQRRRSEELEGKLLAAEARAEKFEALVGNRAAQHVDNLKADIETLESHKERLTAELNDRIAQVRGLLGIISKARMKVAHLSSLLRRRRDYIRATHNIIRVQGIKLQTASRQRRIHRAWIASLGISLFALGAASVLGSPTSIGVWAHSLIASVL